LASKQPKTPRQLAEQESWKTLDRLLDTGIAHGAADDALVLYLERQDPPVENAGIYVTKARRREKRHFLTDSQIDALGGINKLRAEWGLAPLPDSALRPGPVDFPYTEVGDAEFFADQHRNDLRYDHLRERWVQIDQVTGIWVPDDINHVMNLATQAIRARQVIATTLEFPAQRKEAQQWTSKGESRSRLTNTVALAGAQTVLADRGHDWDHDPMLLGCQNGVVDLRTGQLRKAEPLERISMRVRVAYDADARCDLWLRTLAGIFRCDDPDETQRMVEFFQRALGYSLTGDCREECCFFAWGGGSNGKGTTMNTVGWLLADYYDDLPYSALEKSVRGGGIPNDVAKLAGRRFITCSEVNEFTLNESRLKALTGRDPMTARFLHKEFFTFLPVGKIWLSTNNKPKIVGTDEGIWRRIHLIPFTNTFEGANNDKRLKDALRQELPGILAWLVRGCLAWQEQGLNPPR
jgi:putative DNA primase/helicase